MGGSGGGGASGAVSHSAYLETIHKDWLNATGLDTIEKSVTEVMDSALGSSPWTGLTAYNPDTAISAYEAEMVLLKALLTGLVDTTDWAALYAQAETTIVGPGEAALIADADAFADILDADINTKILPRFRRGMQDINAVVSSAFVIGEAIIEGFRDRELAKYTSVARLESNSKKLTATEQMMQMMTRRIAWRGDYAKLSIEANRIKIVAKKEQADQDATIDEADAKWDLEVFQHGGNLMAAIGSGTAIPNLAKTNKAASMLGGALSMASAGAMAGTAVSPGPGTLIGAGIGGVLGAAASFLG